MRVVVAGGTGFVGRELVGRLAARGDSVVVLTRDAGRVRLPGGAVATTWTPERDGPWGDVVNGADAVVNLAGEPVLGRWTADRKRRIRDSRVLSTRAVVEAIRRATTRPRVLLNASAIGYYGMHPPDVELDETSPPGEDFLASVVKAWEQEALAAEALGVRVVRLRIGIVLGEGGGALAAMARPFRFFAGGRVGSGDQILSWIHVSDLVDLALLAIDDDRARGAIDATAPEPASMREVAAAIGRALGRPAWLPAPAFAVRAALGEAAEAVLGGQRVLPRAAEALGFRFSHIDLQEAVRSALGSAKSV